MVASRTTPGNPVFLSKFYHHLLHAPEPWVKEASSKRNVAPLRAPRNVSPETSFRTLGFFEKTSKKREDPSKVEMQLKNHDPKWKNPNFLLNFWCSIIFLGIVIGDLTWFRNSAAWFVSLHKASLKFTKKKDLYVLSVSVGCYICTMIWFMNSSMGLSNILAGKNGYQGTNRHCKLNFKWMNVLMEGLKKWGLEHFGTRSQCLPRRLGLFWSVGKSLTGRQVAFSQGPKDSTNYMLYPRWIHVYGIFAY